MLYYDFEKPIIELEKNIEELKRYSEEVKVDASAEIEGLIKKRDALCSEVYSKLTPY